MIDEKKLEEIILKHAVKNAHDYGQAKPGAVVGKVIGEYPEVKWDMKQVMSKIKEIVDYVNGLSEEERTRLMDRFTYQVKKEKTIEEKIRDDVPNAEEGKVITRLPPEPNAPGLHIGHAKAMWLDRLVADLFKGRCILRWDDTNPEKEREEYVEGIREDLVSLGIAWDDEVFASDHMEEMYELAERLIKQGDAYVCTCDKDIIKKNRESGTACSCRERTPEENLRLWKDMLSGKISPGKAILRMKGDLTSKNTAMRDPTLFRIIDIEKHPHYRQGKRYWVWPAYDFEGAVMDSLLGITHPIRSKEYEIRNEPYYYLLDRLGLRKPHMIIISRLNIPGYPVSKRMIKPLVDQGLLWGWDDPRLVTIKGLLRRGIRPEAIKRFALRFGISTVESNPDIELLFAENKKIIDPTSPRRFFVKDPIQVKVNGLDHRRVVLRNHPVNDMGTRQLEVDGRVYVSLEDLKQFKVGDVFRLKDLCNVRVVSMNLEMLFGGTPDKPNIVHDPYSLEGPDNRHKHHDYDEITKLDVEVEVVSEEEYPSRTLPKIQWVPIGQEVKTRVYRPGRLLDDRGELLPIEKTMSIEDGFAEVSCKDLRVGDIVQFERYGFVRLDRKSERDGKVFLEFIYTHD